VQVFGRSRVVVYGQDYAVTSIRVIRELVVVVSWETRWEQKPRAGTN
jgi:hypothetical protein